LNGRLVIFVVNQKACRVKLSDYLPPKFRKTISPGGILNPGSLKHEYYTVNSGVITSAGMKYPTITLKPMVI